MKIVDIHYASNRTGGNEYYPKMFAPFGGFSDNTPLENGMVGLPEIPGVGFEAMPGLIDRIRPLFDPARRS